METNTPPKAPVKRTVVDILLMLFAVLAAAGAVVRMLAVDKDILQRLDTTTLTYLGVAGALLLLREVKTLTFGDYKIEFERVLQIAEEAKNTAENAQAAAIGDGRKTVAEDAPESVRAYAAEMNESDPWKGKFGGAVNGTRRLEAEVRPIAGAADYYKIVLRVRSTDPNDPVRGTVQFFLHPTFRNDKPIVTVGPSGVAELHLTGWGAFTVGAVADSGRTPLELDLSELESAPAKFRTS